MVSNVKLDVFVGYHGCDAVVRDQLITLPQAIKRSDSSFDWLGHGFYVWESSYKRAYRWAQDKQKRGQLQTPAVVGVVYELGNCLDLTDAYCIELIQRNYHGFAEMMTDAGLPLPQNKNIGIDEHKDLLLRHLDCAVIEYTHATIDETLKSAEVVGATGKISPFDTVRGVFTEGGPAFPGAGIQAKTHVQICVRNTDCIKGFFLPRREME